MKFKDRKIRAGGNGGYVTSIPKAIVESLKTKIVSIEDLPEGSGILLRCSPIDPAKVLKIVKK